MLRVQYLRAVLLLNNPIAATVGIIVGTSWWHNGGVVFALAGFLLASWLMTMGVLIYVKVQSRAAKKAGYFRVPSHLNDSGTMGSASVDKGNLSRNAILFLMLADIIYAITFIILSTLTFVMFPTAAGSAAGIGGIVAGVTHAFYVLLVCHYASLGKYRIKVSITRRDEGDRLENLDTTKESSEESSMHEPERLLPAPYHGSPSTKPSKTSASPIEGPIRLIDPSEGDRLIADHD